MDAIETLLTRGVDKIYPSREALEKALRSGRKLKLYQGFDPTGTQLHIGHAVAIRKLKQFQNLGHHVIFLIGDITAMIGDPSGKFSARKMLTREEVLENAKTYKEQASKILKFTGLNPAEIKYNSEWLGKMNAFEFLRIANMLSVQQVVERDMFQKRIKQDQDVFMNEFLYPVLQAYDSIAMDVDLEIGGSDQMFNMMMGRKLMRKMKQKEKFVLTVPLLTDAAGNKIGKTEGNMIGITDQPNDFYGKIMALADSAIVPCFNLLTDMPLTEIVSIRKAMDTGENPINFKKLLAFELTKEFNDELAANVAQTYFETTFQKGETTGSLEEFPLTKLTSSQLSIINLLLQTKSVTSKSEARRLVEQKGVDIDQTVVDLVNTNITLKPGMTLKVGKKRFLRFV